MGKAQTPRKRMPKVRSYVRPTKVHTPKPKKKPKYPKQDFEKHCELEVTVLGKVGKGKYSIEK